MPNVFSKFEQDATDPNHDQLTRWLLTVKKFNMKAISPMVTLEDYASAKCKANRKSRRTIKHKSRNNDSSDSESKEYTSKADYVQMEVPVADGDVAKGSLKMKMYLPLVSGSTTPIQFFQFIQDEKRLSRKLRLLGNYGARLGHVGSLMKPGAAENAFNSAQDAYQAWCTNTGTAPVPRTRFKYTLNEIAKMVFGPSWADSYLAQRHYLEKCFQMDGKEIPSEEIRDLKELNEFLPYFPLQHGGKPGQCARRVQRC